MGSEDLLLNLRFLKGNRTEKNLSIFLAFSACISEAKKISLPQVKFPWSYGQSKTILLLYFLLWAGLRDDVDQGKDARG